jgi:hypothetical protein
MSNAHPTKPDFRAYAVTKRDDKKAYWHPIGAAWSHSDGEGFSLKLEYLPLNGADISLRRIKPDEAGSAD